MAVLTAQPNMATWVQEKLHNWTVTMQIYNLAATDNDNILPNNDESPLIEL